MKKHLPQKSVIAVFGVLSLLLAAVATMGPSTDVMLAVISMPLFVICALMGMHKAGRLVPVRQEISIRERRK